MGSSTLIELGTVTKGPFTSANNSTPLSKKIVPSLSLFSRGQQDFKSIRFSLDYLLCQRILRLPEGTREALVPFPFGPRGFAILKNGRTEPTEDFRLRFFPKGILHCKRQHASSSYATGQMRYSRHQIGAAIARVAKSPFRSQPDRGVGDSKIVLLIDKKRSAPECDSSSIHKTLTAPGCDIFARPRHRWGHRVFVLEKVPREGLQQPVGPTSLDDWR